MNQQFFILCRDRAEARRLRRAVAEHSIGFNIQVGTWIELVQAALGAYCLSQPQDCWQTVLGDAIERLPHCFWSKSFRIAPAETIAIISHELRRILQDLGHEQKLEQFSGFSLSQRGRRHLGDLVLLHNKMSSLLPVDLEATQKLIATPKKDALRLLKVALTMGKTDLNPWQAALIGKLNNDANSEDTIAEFNESDLIREITIEANSNSALNLLQRNLYQDSAVSGSLDKSLQWLALRDYLEEVEVVAGMIQKALEQNANLRSQEIALLLPDNPVYSEAVREVFCRAGLPLSGLTVKRSRRDLGRELIFHLLQTLRKPAPIMAMTAFACSPLLLWPRQQGFEIADTLMRGDYNLGKIKVSGSSGNDILDCIRNGANTVVGIENILEQLPSWLNNSPELADSRNRAVTLSEELSRVLKGAQEIPWNEMLSLSTPASKKVEVEGEFSQEGIAVFYESAEPWRAIRNLYILGFNEGHYPQAVKTSPVFSRDDFHALNDNGCKIQTPTDISELRRSLFRRQLGAAAEKVVFTLSRRDAFGKQISPSTSLPFMAQLFGQGSSPETLIFELDTTAGRQAANGLAEAPEALPKPMRKLEVADLSLDFNLLTIGQKKDGSLRPQSPSSIETLMTSPLAWLFNRAGLEPRDWETEKLDVMSKGTLAHTVFEWLFAPGDKLPNDQEVKQSVPALLKKAILQIKPFLNRPEWKVERHHLEKEILQAAERWRQILESVEARILGVEVWLKGQFDQQPIHGSADQLLELPDGRVYVVDYKKSSSNKRRERMLNGYDSQASLYRIMLQTGEGSFRSSDGSIVSVSKESEIGALYYLMNDQTALADSEDWIKTSSETVEELGANVSAQAMPLIKKRFEQVSHGFIKLNRDSDEKWFEKNAGIILYALDNSPLIRMFMLKGEE
ncbi:MAG: exodeoxyribonuclease V subunit gamma [Deltaproteobacteria bacterium]|nr:exodeoxyribonuclease V subunit gamma [Deltaproteobacteria bacterium]